MIVFLDTGPLGGIINPSPRSEEVKSLQAWGRKMVAANHRLIVPAIVDYEQRREHLRRRATATLAELDRFVYGVEGRYLSMTDTALRLAAEFWADLRQRGLPTADVKAIDGDVILAAQVLDLGLPEGSFTVETGNVSDLSRVVACRTWQEVEP